MRKRNLYGAKKTNGYDSKAEAARAEQLKSLLDQGLIENLREQVPFVISQDCEHGCKPIRYIADFVYIDNRKVHGKKGIEIVEDVKGRVLPIFNLKLKLLLCKYPHINFVISKAIYTKKILSGFTEELRKCPNKKR